MKDLTETRSSWASLTIPRRLSVGDFVGSSRGVERVYRLRSRVSERVWLGLAE